jgi:hypothetical protein
MARLAVDGRLQWLASFENAIGGGLDAVADRLCGDRIRRRRPLDQLPHAPFLDVTAPEHGTGGAIRCKVGGAAAGIRYDRRFAAG